MQVSLLNCSTCYLLIKVESGLPQGLNFFVLLVTTPVEHTHSSQLVIIGISTHS